jgi:dimethylsulfone monooxygenase
MSDPGPALLNDQPMKLGVFASNCSGGLSMTEAPRTLEITWEHQKEIARKIDDLGFEAIVPIARWKGFGGNTNFNGRSFETFTWAAGLAEATKNISVVSTTHVATIDPVVAAKMAATVDHISGGRFGLNVVMGWFTPEMAMMQCQLLGHDERYGYGAEWLDFLEQLWTRTEPFDFDGTFFHAVGCESEPKPLQTPRPFIINAGNSPAGVAFSAKYADINFFASPDLEQMATYTANVKQLAREEHRRDIRTMTAAIVICRDTEAEAKRVYDEILEKGDWPGADNLMSILGVQSESFSEQIQKFKERFITGWGTMPLVGTPEQVVEGFAGMAKSGMEGALLGFLDYSEEIDHFGENVLPLMREAGLRN